MKRYSIVRVEINCPYDVCGEEDFCFLSKGKTLEDMCNYCDFLDEKIIIGDTKEQLIAKVETAIKRNLKGGYSVTYRKFGKRYIKDGVSARELAESIVEFLGAEE